MNRRKAWSVIFIRNLLLASAAPDLLRVTGELQSEPWQDTEESHHLSPLPEVGVSLPEVGVSLPEMGVSLSEVGVSRAGSRS